MTISSSMLELFVSFIKERERVRVMKSKHKPLPWTQDPIISKYRFCNVNRQHDRQTVLLQRWLYKDKKAKWVEFNAVPMRLFNQAHTMDAIGWLQPATPWWENVKGGVAEVKRKGLTPFNGAYIVSTNGVQMNKVDYILGRILRPLAKRWGDAPYGSKSCQAWADFYMGTDGLGNFIANQIVTDLKYGPLHDAKDWKTFVLAGPGTMRGLNRLLKRDINTPMKQDAARELLSDVRDLVWNEVPFHEYFDDLNNLSNCFCEFDKYRRTVEKQGKPKQLYTPHV